MCNVYINVYLSVHGFLCMYLMIFSSLINLWYALLASSHLKKKKSSPHTVLVHPESTIAEPIVVPSNLSLCPSSSSANSTISSTSSSATPSQNCLCVAYPRLLFPRPLERVGYLMLRLA